MENKRIRCHFSIILENCWKAMAVLFLLFLSDLDDAKELVLETHEFGWILLLLLPAVMLLIFLYHLVRWRKTTVILEEDVLIWERATINKKTLTIDIGNISSINQEQNLFEQLIGTSRLKIDTNSLSTANQTDISLLFKKEVSLEFQELLQRKMNLIQNPGMESGDSEKAKMAGSGKGEEGKLLAQYTSSLADIAMHSIYTLSLGSVLLTMCLIFGVIGSFLDLIEEMRGSDVWGVLGTAVIGAVIVISFLGAVVRKFFIYYNLTAERRDQRIFLRYGLLKLREYTIPVETVNSLTIKQTLIGRICKRYSAVIECIGVGDESDETAQLTLSLPYEELLERIGRLLPEYELDALEQDRPVPTKALWYKLAGNLWLVLLAVIVWAGIRIVSGGGWEPEIPLFSGNTMKLNETVIVLGAFMICLFCNLIRIVLNMRTERFGMGENFVELTTGSFGRTTVFLQYRKIQYLEYKASPLARCLGLYEGIVYILSKASANKSPIVSGDEIEKMRSKCLL